MVSRHECLMATSSEALARTTLSVRALTPLPPPAYRRLLPDSPMPLSSTPLAFSPQAEPTLLVMTAEPGILTSIAAEPLAAPYRILSTPPPSIASSTERASADDIKNARKEFRDRKLVAYGRKGDEKEEPRRKEKRGLGLSAGYDQATFNLLPLRERVTHTRAFVRDLTLLAKHADAFVVSGKSLRRLPQRPSANPPLIPPQLQAISVAWQCCRSAAAGS